MARWIKIGVDTPYKRQINRIMNKCECSRGDAFLAFFTFFAWVDELTSDGVINVGSAEIDRHVDLYRFTDAMTDAGWLEPISEGGFRIVNFLEHNGRSAKTRALHAKRENAYKERKRAAGLPVRSLPPLRK